MKALVPKPQCDPSLLLLLWSCYTLTFPVLRQLWSWINPQMWWMFWSFVTTLQNMSWHMWPPIKLPKQLLSFCGKDISWTSEHWPCSWVTEEPTLSNHAQTNWQVVWAHQMLMHMIGKLCKDQKVDWPRHLPKLVHDYQIQPTLFDVWVLMTPTHWLLFPHGKGHEEMPACWPLCCWVMWMVVGSLQRGSSAVHVRGWETEMVLWQEKLMPFHCNQVTWSWLKPMTTRRRGKWRTGGRRNHTKWSTRLLKTSLPTLWKTSRQDAHKSSTKTNFFSSFQQRGLLSVGSCELSRPDAPPLP